MTLEDLVLDWVKELESLELVGFRNLYSGIFDDIHSDIDSKNFSVALKKSESFTLEHPEVELGWLFKGRALYELGNFKKAISSYKNALKLNPKSEDSLTGFCS